MDAPNPCIIAIFCCCSGEIGSSTFLIAAVLNPASAFEDAGLRASVLTLENPSSTVEPTDFFFLKDRTSMNRISATTMMAIIDMPATPPGVFKNDVVPGTVVGKISVECDVVEDAIKAPTTVFIDVCADELMEVV